MTGPAAGAGALLLLLAPVVAAQPAAAAGTAPTYTSTAFDRAASAGLLDRPTDVALAPDGTEYVADQSARTVLALRPGGAVRVVAGSTGGPGAPTDGALAADSRLEQPMGLDLAADGDLYVADAGAHELLRIDTTGVLHVVASGFDQLVEVGVAAVGDAAGQAVAQVGEVVRIAVQRVAVVVPAVTDHPQYPAVLVVGVAGLLLVRRRTHRREP